MLTYIYIYIPELGFDAPQLSLNQLPLSLSALSASRCSGGGRATVWPRHYSGGRGPRPQRRPGLTTACAHGGDTTLGFTC